MAKPMHLYSMSILTPNEGKIIHSEHNLDSFSFFQRSSVAETLDFCAATLVQRTQMGTRRKVEEKGYTFYIFVSPRGVAGAVATDKDYPSRAAFSLINNFLDQFCDKNPNFQATANVQKKPSPELKEMLAKYQDPTQADSLLRVQKELDETKVVLSQTMQSVLERGEKLDDLVAQSSNLSAQTRVFYKTAKSTNACCTIS